MKNIIRKIAIFSILGLVQIGLGTPVIEASPLHNSASMQQQNAHDRDEAERIENERHEREMERRPNESEQEWNERQSREKAKHERNLMRIARAIIM